MYVYVYMYTYTYTCLLAQIEAYMHGHIYAHMGGCQNYGLLVGPSIKRHLVLRGHKRGP